MKRQTRTFLLNAATGIAIAATAALVLMPTIASAAAGTATTFVNVRSAPSSTARVVNTLDAGEAVDVQGCEGGWCYVGANGNDGYVSQRYLSISGPGVDIGFTVQGPQGNSVTFGFNTDNSVKTPPPPVDDDEPLDGEACFFENSQYRGGSFCVAAGDYIPNLGGWDGDISSIENPDGLDVTVCTRTNLRGECRTYTTSARSLGRFNDNITSLSVD